MTTAEKLELLAETLDVEVDEISEETELMDLDTWDSMTKLSLIVMFDDEFGKKITSEDIKKFVCVSDILACME
ncbi:MAG: acyl carrier protein [Clostridia bacterium]|nr:acyl carrier protein [Clostridia bacterium]